MMLLTRKYFLFSFVFLFSFSWIAALTYNFPLFWEDTPVVNGYTTYINNTEHYSYSALFSQFVCLFITPEQFYRITYADRPLAKIFLSPFLVAILGFNPVILRLLKAFIFAGLITLYFAFSRALCTRAQRAASFFAKFDVGEYAIIPFLVAGYVLVLPEVWITALYFIDTLTYVLFFSTAAILLFYFFYNNDSIQNKWILSVLFLSITFFTQFATSLQHVGRINFLLFLVFLLFTEWKKVLRFRYWSLILVLFFLSFPIIGIFGVLSGKSILSILGVTGHMGVAGGNFFGTLLVFVTSIYLTFLPHAFFLVLSFILFVILHIYAVFVGNKEAHDKKEAAFLSSLKALVIFSFFWFIFNAAMLFAARGFVFEPKYFLRFEFTLFLFSQVLFLISYCIYVYRRYFSSRKILYYVILFFVAMSILHNLSRLNEWRGGWGAYFLGYDTARQYVDENATGAVLLLPMDHGSPVYFSPISTNTHAMVADLTNSSVVRSYSANYSTVYIASRQQLVFDDPAIINIANLTVVDKSPYGLFKKAIRRYYNEPFYLYALRD